MPYESRETADVVSQAVGDLIATIDQVGRDLKKWILIVVVVSSFVQTAIIAAVLFAHVG